MIEGSRAIDLDKKYRDDGGAVVSVTGDLDTASAYRLPEYVSAIVAEGPLPSVTINLSAVTFIDSVGLGMLVRCENESAEHGVVVVLQSPSHVVTRLLQITALDRTMTVI